MASKRTYTRALPALALALLLVACATPRIVAVSPETTPTWLSFLVDGKTTREELLLHFGVPSMEFEGERIFTFLLTAEGANVRPCGARLYFGEEYALRRPVHTHWADYHLVVVFRPDNVVERHSLIAVGQLR